MGYRRMATVSAGVVLALALAGCGGVDDPVGDKAGGSSATVTLTMGTTDWRGRPDTPTVEYFLQRLTSLTHGSVKVDVRWGDTNTDTDFEQALARQVSNGQLDLGWVGSRAFDTLGVKSLEAIQAPFLITDTQVMGRVAQDPVADRMLAGLGSSGFIGLALVPGELRHPVGIRKALASLDDFKAARVRTPTSNVSDAVLRALGAEPVHLGPTEYDLALHDGTLDGTETSLRLASSLGGSVLTGNIVLYPRMHVLFTTDAALGQLDRAQREALVTAADEAVRHAVEVMPDAEDGSEFCAGQGQVVNASASELAVMREATAQVYAELEADPDTKANIGAIRAIAQQVSPARTLQPCGAPEAAVSATVKALVPDGVYVATATKADALRLGVHDECALKSDGGRLRLELAHGQFTQWEKCSILPDQIGSQGTYTVTPDTFTFHERCCGASLVDWSFDGRYLTLKLRPSGDGSPIEPGAQLVVNHRWEKVG